MKVKRVFPWANNTIAHLPNQWDIFAISLLLGFLGWLVWCGAQMAAPYKLGQVFTISLDSIQLPHYAALTVMRMLIALMCSLLFTLIVGTIAAKNEPASRWIIPLIDVLQSVPVLGFLSLTVTGFIRLFPGSRIGPECAAIFAIFTAQVWNMTLSFYQSLKAIPNELREATTLFQLSSWQRFWRLEVPCAIPALLWNMMLSMSGSWVFLVASESIAVANQTIHLPGIGSYLGFAIASSNFTAVLQAVGTMLIVILLYDQLFFRPLLVWSHKFALHDISTEHMPRAWLITILQRTRILKSLHMLLRYGSEKLLQARIFNYNYLTSSHDNNAKNAPYIAVKKLMTTGLFLLLCATLLYFATHYIEWKLAPKSLLLGSFTAFRVITAVLVSSVIWIPIGIWIGLRPHLTTIVQPIAQFLAAFPANVLFPVVVITLLKFHLSFEVGVLPLMILGTQWYILFNVIAGMRAIPKELYQMSQNFNLKGWIWWKHFILPSIFSHLIIGIMTAVGAAWNISVVAEVMQWGENTLTVKGLGSYIAKASVQGNFQAVAMGMIAMSSWVLMMNYFIWQPLYQLAQSKYKMG